MNILNTALKGLCMGAADVVPGVSGGTMALILGIYERLLRAIRQIDLEFLRLLHAKRFVDATRRIDLPFLLTVGTGIICAVMFFTRVVKLPSLITTHPQFVYGLFFGLIVASTGILLLAQRPLTAARLSWIVIGVLIGFGVVNLVPMQTPTAGWFIFLCGALAISAMILPGISGSFILLILQKYAYIFDALGRLDVAVIAPFILGCLCGLALFSRFLTWLLRRFHDATMLVIIGVLGGSLWVIWPFQDRSYIIVRGKQRLVHSVPVLPEHWDATVFGAVGLAITGIVLVIVLHVFAKRTRDA